MRLPGGARMGKKQERRFLDLDPHDFIHAARTAFAAVLSLLIARLFRLPEAYWAAIATMIAMPSTLGAVAGALLLTLAGGNIAAFGAGVFLLGPICSALGVEQPAYRYAGITLITVMMIARAELRWMVATHRFAEISIALAVGLLLTAIWPEREPSAA